MKVCRRCGIVLTMQATIAMGICGACLLELENRPAILPRPKYGKSLATDKPQYPEIR
jgi:hypothetical protein